MQAILVSDDGEEAGIVEIDIGNTVFSAMNCLGYGESTQPYPLIGESFMAELTCLCDDEVDWNAISSGNQNEEMKLVKTGLWSYQVFGKIVKVASSDHECLVDCGCCVLSAPIDIFDPSYVGRYVVFQVSRLSVWRA